MKIADEIAEGMVGAADDPIWWASSKEQRIASVASVIAAKLGPIKRATEKFYAYATEHDVGSPLIVYVKEAIALFEEGP